MLNSSYKSMMNRNRCAEFSACRFLLLHFIKIRKYAIIRIIRNMQNEILKYGGKNRGKTILGRKTLFLF